MNWLKRIFKRQRRYDELAESIREHMDEKIADLMSDGPCAAKRNVPRAGPLEMSRASKSAAAKSGSGRRSSLCGRM